MPMNPCPDNSTLADHAGPDSGEGPGGTGHVVCVQGMGRGRSSCLGGGAGHPVWEITLSQEVEGQVPHLLTSSSVVRWTEKVKISIFGW